MSLRVRKADLEIIRGELRGWTTMSDSGNPKICYFCSTCGNRLWHTRAQAGFVHIKPGTLDDRSQLAPRFEGWTKRKFGWLTIDGLEASFETQSQRSRPQVGK